MIGEILAGLSTLGSLYGSLASARQNKLIDAQLQKRQSELDTWYNKEYNQNYLDTEEARSVLRILSNQRKEAMKKVDQGNAITGASDEARVATASKLNQSLGDQTARLAGQGTYRKYLTDRQYQSLKFGLDQMQLQNLQNKSQNWANFMSNAANAGLGFAETSGTGAFDTWENRWKNRRIKKTGSKVGKAIAGTGINF
jgi:hypothetical protein